MSRMHRSMARGLMCFLTRDAKIVAAKQEGRKQYKELVAAIEARYISEFESSLKEIRAQTASDLEASERLKAELVEAKRTLQAVERKRDATMAASHKRQPHSCIVARVSQCGRRAGI